MATKQPNALGVSAQSKPKINAEPRPDNKCQECDEANHKHWSKSDTTAFTKRGVKR